jgi:hypothetical protein
MLLSPSELEPFRNFSSQVTNSFIWCLVVLLSYFALLWHKIPVLGFCICRKVANSVLSHMNVNSN